MHSCIHAFQATPLIAADSATMENATMKTVTVSVF